MTTENQILDASYSSPPTYDANGIIIAGGTVNTYNGPTFDISGDNLEIDLLFLDKTVTMDVSGTIYNNIYQPLFTNYDAVAALDVDLVSFRKIFAVQSDSIDMTNLSNVNVNTIENVRFLVYDDKIDSFTPNLGLNSEVTTGSAELTDTNGVSLDQHVKKDFVRYLAYLLFNTPYATEIFLNLSELVQSVSDALDAAWEQCKVSLHDVSTSGSNANLVVDVSGNYLIDQLDGTDSYNICGEIYKQLVSRQPHRFENLNTLLVNSESDDLAGPNREQFYLPLIAGDKINIKVTIRPSDTQPLYGLTSSINPSKFLDGALKPKVYLIKMTLV